MNCLCCGKPLEENASSAWHKRCIRRFFGTDELPEMQLADEALESYALQTVYKGMTVPGVQRKMSMHLSKEENTALRGSTSTGALISRGSTNEERSG